MKRLVTALLLTPTIVYVVVWAPQFLFLAVLAVIALFCFHEFAGIVQAYGIERPGPVGYGAGLVLVLMPRGDTTLLLVLLALLLLALALPQPDLRKSMPSAAATLLGVLYTFGVWRYAGVLRARGPEGPYWLIFALAACWAGDVAAYYVGRSFGRHKMAPVVSPAKSWEGGAASLAASMLFGWLFLSRVIPSIPLAQVLVLSATANIAGQLGDLAESAFKRGAGVKDSGGMLPGHGGWLDRVDSSLFSIPAVYALVTWLR